MKQVDFKRIDVILHKLGFDTLSYKNTKREYQTIIDKDRRERFRSETIKDMFQVVTWYDIKDERYGRDINKWRSYYKYYAGNIIDDAAAYIIANTTGSYEAIREVVISWHIL